MNVKQWLGAAALAAIFAVAMVSLPAGRDSVLAHEDPENCSQQPARSGASLQVYFDDDGDGSPEDAVGSQPVVAGDDLLYEVGANIGGALPASCTAFDIQVWLLLPGAASYVKVCEIPELTAGDEIFCTDAAADPEAGFPTGFAPYTVDLADLTAAGRIQADTRSRGDVHDSPEDCTLTDAEKNANNPDPGQCFRAATSRSLSHANPQLVIAKECTSDEVTVGQDVNFDVTLTNDSSSTTGVRVEINDISVTDSLSGTLAPPGPFTLSMSGASTTPVFTHTTTAAGTIENTANASSTGVTLYNAANAVLRTLPGVSAGPAASEPDCTAVEPTSTPTPTATNTPAPTNTPDDVSTPPSRREPTDTPIPDTATPPPSTPTPVVTVAGATVVPTQPPPTVITLPAAGDGGSGSAGIVVGVLTGIALLGLLIVGSRVRSRRLP